MKHNYEYRDRTYKNNGHHVIFVHAYKHQKEWKRFLIKKIMEIEEQRHDEIIRNATNTAILDSETSTTFSFGWS